jgi:hypothetical protein
MALAYDPDLDAWTYRETHVPPADCGPKNILSPTCDASTMTFSSHYNAVYPLKLNCSTMTFGF